MTLVYIILRHIEIYGLEIFLVDPKVTGPRLVSFSFFFYHLMRTYLTILIDILTKQNKPMFINPITEDVIDLSFRQSHPQTFTNKFKSATSQKHLHRCIIFHFRKFNIIRLMRSDAAESTYEAVCS